MEKLFHITFESDDESDSYEYEHSTEEDSLVFEEENNTIFKAPNKKVNQFNNLKSIRQPEVKWSPNHIDIERKFLKITPPKNCSPRSFRRPFSSCKKNINTQNVVLNGSEPFPENNNNYNQSVFQINENSNQRVAIESEGDQNKAATHKKSNFIISTDNLSCSKHTQQTENITSKSSAQCDNRNQNAQSIITNNALVLTTSVFSQSESLAIYRCHRTTHMKFGKQTIFGFYENNRFLFSAKAKGFVFNKLIVASEKGNTSAYAQKNPIALITVKNNYESFFLNDQNLQLAEMKFSQINELMPRSVNLNLSDPAENMPSKLRSIRPKYNEKKKSWQLNFKGRFVLRSSKNCILEDEDQVKMMIVRKTTKNDLELEIFRPMDKLIVFFIGISSFLCSL